MRLQPGVYFCVLVTSVSLRSWSANLLSFLDLSLIRRAGILETLLIFWRRLQVRTHWHFSRGARKAPRARQ